MYRSSRMSRRSSFPVGPFFFPVKLAALNALGTRVPEDPSDDDRGEIEDRGNCLVGMSRVYHHDGHGSSNQERGDMVPGHRLLAVMRVGPAAFASVIPLVVSEKSLSVIVY